MQSVLRFLFLGFFIFLSHTVLGQRKVDGTFINIETHVWQYGETDTIINNRDTTYSTPTIMDASDPTDLDRVRELFFTFTKTGDILIDRKLYRRKLKRL